MMPGISGLLVGAAIFLGIGAAVYFTREYDAYNLDPQGKPGAFEPFLAKYIRASEFIIGLATGSIVLLVGSSALHGQGGHLPWFYASPLLLLALCVVFGIALMVWLIYHYEEHQHGTPHSKFAYTLSLTLGFSGQRFMEFSRWPTLASLGTHYFAPSVYNFAAFRGSDLSLRTATI